MARRLFVIPECYWGSLECWVVSGMPIMLSDCVSHGPSEAELLLVGSGAIYEAAKSHRDRMTQAILPLEPSFVLSGKLGEDLGNEQCLNLMATLGAGIVIADNCSMFKRENLMYGKVIIVTEQDEAGQRLRNEVIRFFCMYMGPIVSAGHILVPEIPLRPGFTQEEFVKNLISPATRRLSVVVEEENDLN